MNTYSIRLPNDKLKTYRYITLFILVINAIAFGYLTLNHTNLRTRQMTSFGLILSLIYVAIFFIRQYSKFFSRYKLEISFIVLGVLWLVMGYFIFAIILFASAVLGLYSTKVPWVHFSEKSIYYPQFPPKHINWTEVSNAMLKDDVLTIDMHNNKLLQSSILPDPANNINQEEFNAFCRTMILKATVLPQ